ncbi:unnamed protein product [Clonostachys byssicola]|uniref:3-hydroxyisobutyrate dehydrogenase n=1 Tax=Clonostachys byssicola TaxID=160290 RepID=A0A9N9Y253_9HYPO|nr:unnamed protein product [Clonostachys byssicola]
MAPLLDIRLGFIGLGAMGQPMARRLLDALPATGELAVYDVATAAIDELVSSYPGRVYKASSPRQVAERAEFTITMVPEGRHVESVYLDADTGLISTDLSKHTLVDCSTIDMTTNRLVAHQLRTRFPTAKFFDAPVSGGVIGAEKGTLAIFLGCAESDSSFESILGVLGILGKQIIPCGGPSLGLATKLSNNYLSGLIAIATSEALNMGMRAGLDPATLSRAFSAGTAQNAICDRFNPVPGVVADAPSSKGYAGGFKVQLMRKDFALAVDLAKAVGAKLVLGDAGLDTYTAASNDPVCHNLDSRVVYRYLGGKENWQQEVYEKNGTSAS